MAENLGKPAGVAACSGRRSQCFLVSVWVSVYNALSLRSAECPMIRGETKSAGEQS